ncbi:hypothetical protein MYCTH_2128713 [Thermothelomyces thermophilus ATCC 42464]|uniref:Uncharacterized protein n=1 Tax=Thermothelomyces thermophilus (strain ATCC 42464 / BCRC 31852 / DSM 1799) TaxID=573729 RepID=G2QJ56_THET4|nr:uncharacterized protein MYCTH_2128713 [Thermothelomyces thermophilus ATCC 42464]AEO59631.1 hypothetical protein MYCTH_2128713 [Thermothelomyces thermophilus ATCC 42464]
METYLDKANPAGISVCTWGVETWEKLHGEGRALTKHTFHIGFCLIDGGHYSCVLAHTVQGQRAVEGTIVNWSADKPTPREVLEFYKNAQLSVPDRQDFQPREYAMGPSGFIHAGVSLVTVDSALVEGAGDGGPGPAQGGCMLQVANGSPALLRFASFDAFSIPYLAVYFFASGGVSTAGLRPVTVAGYSIKKEQERAAILPRNPGLIRASYRLGSKCRPLR